MAILPQNKIVCCTFDISETVSPSKDTVDLILVENWR